MEALPHPSELQLYCAQAKITIFFFFRFFQNLRWGEKRELSAEHDNPSKHADPALSEHADPAPSEHAEFIKDADLAKNAEHAEDTCSPDWTEEEKAR